VARAALVWGQYARLGKDTHFGFGVYRIEELGPDPYGCPRGASLLELALERPALDRAAADTGLPSGRVRAAAADAVAGEHAPEPPVCRCIASHDGTERILAVPAPVDRALQRAVLEQLAPALDRFFETSSFAWRRGLGRHSAAQRLRRAWHEGYRYAIREDFDRFFDRVDHGELRDRLEAYVADPPTVELLMRWLRASSDPEARRGLPTGAPISPLLGNLFLDRFDEEIAAAGGHLVRYGDDFMVLFRSREEAEAHRETARHEAQRLALRLNEEDDAVLNLQEPFEFLGFRFERETAWEMRDARPPVRVEDLGWHDASRPAPPSGRIALPGEAETEPAGVVSTVIAGPGLADLRVEDGELVAIYRGGARERRVSLDGVDRVVLLGAAPLGRAPVRTFLEREIPVFLADPNGQTKGTLAPAIEPADAEGLTAQVTAAGDPVRRLAIGRALVAAKLENHAALAEAAGDGDALAGELRDAAARAGEADSLEALRGTEGAAARAWFAGLGRHLGEGFEFPGRRAPAAEDPVNVLMNIAQTALHRQMILAAEQAGLAPTVGLFHEARAGHPALASDLQEPFRHAMDRVVIEATRRLRPDQFRRANRGPYALRLDRGAARTFTTMIHEALARPVCARNHMEPSAWPEQFAAQARALRRHLLDADKTFLPFRHP
jgi:CRISPR-associated endonuclease Cas1